MRTVLVLLLAALIAGAAAWLLWHEERGSASVGGSDERDEAGPRTGPTLEGRAHTVAPEVPRSVGRCGIEGRVTEAGAPVSAVVEAHRVPTRVWAYFAPGGARAFYEARFRPPASAPSAAGRATSDAEGRFAIEGLPAGSYELVARGDGGARADRVVDLPTAGGRAWADLELLAPGHALRGHVFDTDGRPVEGRVIAWAPVMRNVGPWEVAPPVGVAEAAIAADGGFTLEGLVPGRHVLRLLLPGGGAVLGPLVDVPRTEPLEILVPACPVTLEGRVIAEPGGDPLERASIVLYQGGGPTTSTLLRPATSDADGRFTLPAPEGEVSLLVETPGFAARWLDVPHPREGVLVRLLRLARVEGRVTAKDGGAPAVGARVVASGGEWTEGLSEATCDAQGRYVLLGVPPGSPQILVLGGGWASPGLGTETEGQLRRSLSVDVPADARLTHDLVAEPAVRLEGRLQAADGRPVRGACVSVGSLEVEDDGRWLLRELLPERALACDAQGAFAFEGFPAGIQCRLAAWGPGQPPLVHPVPMGAPGPVHVELQFERACTLVVSVVGEEDGAPIAGALVSANADGLPEPAQALTAVLTGVDGRARLSPVGGGALSVSAHCGEISASATTDGAEGAPGDRSLEIRLRRGLTLRGQVLKADGSPATAAEVSAEHVDGSSSEATGHARRDGTFLLEGLAAGRWIVRAQSDDVESGRQAVDAGADGIVLRLAAPLPPGETHDLRVHVLDPQGRPVPTFSAHLSGAWGAQDADGLEGVARFERLGAGGSAAQGWLEVHSAAGGDELPLDLAPARLPLGPKLPSELEVRLLPGLSIEGHVRLADGSPAAGVQVETLLSSALPTQGEDEVKAFDDVRVNARTDRDGRFRLRGLGEGRHLLTFDGPSEQMGPREPLLVDAGTRNVDVRLRSSLRARVRVLTWDGRPLAQAQVEAVAEGGQAPSMSTDERGIAQLEGLDPDLAWSLGVEPPEGAGDALPLSLPHWRPADGDVRLERARAVAGVVRDPSGSPVEGARVGLVGEDGTYDESQTTGADGRFRLGRLAAHTVRVGAGPPSLGDDANAPPKGSPVLTVAAGREDLVLTVDPGPVVRLRLTERSQARSRSNAQILSLSFPGEPGHQTPLHESEELGLFRAAGLEPGQAYAFWLQIDATHYAYAEFDAGSGDVRVPVREGRTIRGRLSDFTLGDQEQVFAQSAQGIMVTVWTNREGRFELQGLPPGLWRLRSQRDVGDTREVAEGSVEAGGTLDLAYQRSAPR